MDAYFGSYLKRSFLYIFILIDILSNIEVWDKTFFYEKIFIFGNNIIIPNIMQ